MERKPNSPPKQPFKVVLNCDFKPKKIIVSNFAVETTMKLKISSMNNLINRNLF